MSDAAASAARRFAAGLGVALLLLQLTLLNHDFTVDGLVYATAVERGEPLLHPNHLLFNALHFGLLKLLDLFAIPLPRAAWLMQGVNIVAACAAAAAFARIALARSDRLTAAGIGLLLLAGFGFWTFSQEPEVYVLPAALVALSLLRLERTRLAMVDACWLALLCAAAVLLLQQYVFWYPVLLWLAWQRLPDRRARLVLLLLPWMLPLAVYVVLGLANDAFASFDAAMKWFLGYGWRHDGLGTYRAAAPLALRFASLLLALGNLWFAYELIAAPFWWAIGALSLALLAVAVAPAAASPERWRRSAPLLAFALLNLVFAFWWEARNIEFLLPVWLVFVALLAQHAAHLRPRLLVAGVLLLLLVNAALAMWPQRDWPQRYRLAAALAAAEDLRTPDVLLTEELNTVLWLDYLHDRRVRFMPGAINGLMHGQRDAVQVRRDIAAALAGGARVYTLEMVEHGRLRALAARLPMLGRPLPDGGVDAALELAYQGFELRPVAAVPGAFRVLAAEAAP